VLHGEVDAVVTDVRESAENHRLELFKSIQAIVGIS